MIQETRRDIPVDDQSQFRSIVRGLMPGTKYDINVTFDPDGHHPHSLFGQTTTFSSTETLPISNNIILRPIELSPLTINTGGTSIGYTLITPSPTGTTWSIPPTSAQDAIIIDAPYVIIRGLTPNGSRLVFDGIPRHCIRLTSNAHHIIIEDCIALTWGLNEPGYNNIGQLSHAFISNAGATPLSNHHIIIQRNTAGPPRFGSWHWGQSEKEERPGPNGNNSHPWGPCAISLIDPGPQNFIGFNRFVFSSQRRANDLLHKGLGPNDVNGVHGYSGFPGDWSHIIGNVLKYAWDDAIEVEGRGCGVVVEGNFIDYAYHAIGASPCTIGPLVIVGNIAGPHLYDRPQPRQDGDYGKFVKLGDRKNGGGRVCLFNNTMLISKRYGAKYAVATSTGDEVASNILSMNNIYDTNRVWRPTIRTGNRHNAASFESDYDTVRRYTNVMVGDNAVVLTENERLIFENDTGDEDGDFRVARESVGYKKGKGINNITRDGDEEWSIGALEIDGSPAYKNAVAEGEM